MTAAIDIAALLPHAGAMVLLDRVERWDAGAILCSSGTHLDPDNPLRRDGRLGAVMAAEYGLQAAALHGALIDATGTAQAGHLASLRDLALAVDRLDDPTLGRLSAEAVLERQEAHAAAYGFTVRAEDGRVLASGRSVIALRGAR